MGVCVRCSRNCVYMCIHLSIVSVCTVCCFLPLPKPLPLLWCGGSQLKVGTTSSQAQRRVHSLHCVCFQEHTHAVLVYAKNPLWLCLSVLCIKYMHSLISSPHCCNQSNDWSVGKVEERTMIGRTPNSLSCPTLPIL